MTLLKKIMTATMLIALFSSSTVMLHAEEACVPAGGCAYEESCRTSSLAPAIALGAIAVIAIVAVAVQNTSGHSHCHAHD